MVCNNTLKYILNILRFTEDYLKIIKIVASDIFQKTITKIILWAVLLLHITITMIQVYFVLYLMDFKENIQYGAVFFGTFHVSKQHFVCRLN